MSDFEFMSVFRSSEVLLEWTLCGDQTPHENKSAICMVPVVLIQARSQFMAVSRLFLLNLVTLPIFCFTSFNVKVLQQP